MQFACLISVSNHHQHWLFVNPADAETAMMQDK